MRLALALLMLAAVAGGCSSIRPAHPGHLVGLPASEAICRVAKDGLSYRIGSGPVVKPSPEIACRRADGPEPKIIHVAQDRRTVILRATCDPVIGCF